MLLGKSGKKKACDNAKINVTLSNKERFDRIISKVNNVEYYKNYDRTQVVSYMIQVIVEGMNHYQAMLSLQYESHEMGDENGSRNNAAVLYIYKDIERMLFPEKDIRTVNVNKEIDINSMPILLNPWKGDNVILNLTEINDANVFDCERHSGNIDNTYIKPLNIAVCNGANHSQYAARIKNKGRTLINHEYDLSPLYEKVKFDGDGFLNTEKSEYIELKCNKEILFYAGVLFELGRFLI